MPYTSVTVVEANSCRGAIALVFDSDFHVTDRFVHNYFQGIFYKIIAVDTVEILR
ncbi:hypothetical protein GGI26_002100, partial [Coemansia sp. RSA 1358]